jgi:hypothetical protein
MKKESGRGSSGDGTSGEDSNSVIETVHHMKCKMINRRRLMGHSARIFDTAFSPKYVVRYIILNAHILTHF